jgi:hypothetical protein
MRHVRSMLAAAAAAALVGGAAASAQTTVVEHFNNYGEDRVNLSGLGSAEGGWAGAWGVPTSTIRPDYLPGVHLAYNDAYYNNLPNLSGATHGVATYEAGGMGSLSGQRVSRAFETPLTGTIWISALAHLDGPAVNETNGVLTAPDIILWLNSAANTQNYIGLRSVNLSGSGTPDLVYEVSSSARFAGQTPTPYVGTFDEGVVHHMLARIDVDVNPEGHDALSFWINPDLSGGEAGLGTPQWQFSDVDAYGAGLASIGISFTGYESYLDSLRLSNAADGFRQVTLLGAPDPLAGDANRDGQVNIADLGILAGNWQSDDAYWEKGDFSGDGSVTIADLGILAANWQAGTNGGMGFAEALAMFDVFDGVVVPEPGALGLLALAGLVGLRRRR